MPDEQVETVLSKEELQTATETVVAAPDIPREKTPEEKEQARVAYERRQQAKNWRSEIRKIEDRGLTDEERAAVAKLAKDKGYDTSKEENKGHVDLIAEANAAQAAIRTKAKNNVLTQAARENLAGTLEELEYEKGSEGFNAIGNHLFRKFGTDNPDAFNDKDLMSKEIENYQQAITRKGKIASPVERAVTAKAGAPKPASESRSGTQIADDAAKNKKEAERLGVSETKAPKILEKQNKLPSWARPKPQ